MGVDPADGPVQGLGGGEEAEAGTGSRGHFCIKDIPEDENKGLEPDYCVMLKL